MQSIKLIPIKWIILTTHRSQHNSTENSVRNIYDMNSKINSQFCKDGISESIAPELNSQVHEWKFFLLHRVVGWRCNGDKKRISIHVMI